VPQNIPQNDDTHKLIKNQNIRLGIVGRLEWRQKGLGHLIEIATALRLKRSDVTWVIIGNGPDRGRLEAELAIRGLTANFEFRGWMENREDIYSSFDLLLVPSFFEGVPMIMLEALAKAIPVLARLTPGTQVFEEYLPPLCLYRDTASAVSKLMNVETLLDDFRKFSKPLQQRIIEQHSLQRFSDQLHNVMECLLPQTKKSTSQKSEAT
jgi:glycosyltransferase involved in cell wall biosynthesis